MLQAEQFVKRVQLSEMRESEEFVGELIRELRFSLSELLLLEGGS
jgi:hypothetical protein